MTINRELREHPYGLHQDREEGAGSPPASSAAFCALGSRATEGASNHSIRAKRPQGKLRRSVAGLDHTRILHLFDVLPILLPLHIVLVGFSANFFTSCIAWSVTFVAGWCGVRGLSCSPANCSSAQRLSVV